jgi:putative heme iron utilization protein
MPNETPSPAITIRHLLRGLRRVALGTSDREEPGRPYVSLAMVALDLDATPLLLLSDLAEHTRNIAADPRVSLLFDATVDAPVPLSAARATLQGRAAVTTEPRHLVRYVARHPDAADYAGFRDFRLYAVAVDRAHLVAGFGRIHWVPGEEVLLPPAAVQTLGEAEPEILQHMNEEHVDAIQLYAQALLGRRGQGWRLSGIDPDGCDLVLGTEAARLGFDKPVHTAEDARAELVRLVRQARARHRPA